MKKIGIILFLYFIVSIFVFAYFFKYAADEQRNIANEILYSTGRLAVTYEVIKDDVNSRNNAKDISEVISQQAFLVSDLKFKISDLNDSGFEGLCVIIAKRNIIFSVEKEKNVKSIMNNFLFNEFSSMEAAVIKENEIRRKRPGDQHRCMISMN